MALPIEDYALIGDRGTAALVGKDGSIDWLCLPRFDSPACFAALLGTEENGRWLLAPADEVLATSRQYLDGTACLETTFTVADGEVVLLDVMPVGDDRADVVRRLTCTRGTVRIRHDWVVRTDYGRVRPWVSRENAHGNEVVVAVAGPDKLVLRGPHLPHGHDGHHSDEFELTAGDEVTFSTTWVRSWRDIPRPLGFDERIDATTARQREWSARSPEDVPHADMVRRSLLTLLLMTHAETGGIVAAPTTSLPEDFGGERNWDYRFCWLRDAALTLEALLGCGYVEETALWRDWLLRAVAVDQRQTDVLGEVMISLEHARQRGLEENPDSWSLQRKLVNHLATHWEEADNGLWEIRGPLRHFTHSRAMVWAAFDRAVKGVEEYGLEGPVERWRELRDRVRREVLDKGYDPVRNTFVQHYDTGELDASLLTLSSIGFVDGDDPRMIGTIRAVEEDLLRDGLVMRYRTQTGVDGLAGDEPPFLAC